MMLTLVAYPEVIGRLGACLVINTHVMASGGTPVATFRFIHSAHVRKQVSRWYLYQL